MGCSPRLNPSRWPSSPSCLAPDQDHIPHPRTQRHSTLSFDPRVDTVESIRNVEKLLERTKEDKRKEVDSYRKEKAMEEEKARHQVSLLVEVAFSRRRVSRRRSVDG